MNCRSQWLIVTAIAFGAGCGGGSGGSSAGGPVQTFSASDIALGSATKDSLALRVHTDGKIDATFSYTGALPKLAKAAPAAQGEIQFSGQTVDSSGTFYLTDKNNPSNVLFGTLPAVPAMTESRFTLTLSGTSYGAYQFGDNKGIVSGKYYSVIMVPLPDGPNIASVAFNNKAQIAGILGSFSSGQAYFYDPATGYHTVSAVGGSKAVPKDIDDNSRVVGVFDPSGTSGSGHVFTYQTGSFQDIGLPSGAVAATGAWSMDSGSIIVQTDTALGTSASVYSNGSYTALDPSNPGRIEVIYGFHSGTVVGESFPNGQATDPNAYWWKWSNGTFAKFPGIFNTPSFTTGLQPVAYSAAGAYAGDFGGIDPISSDYILYADGQKTDLGKGWALTGVNASGQAVGAANGAQYVYSKTNGQKDLLTVTDPKLPIGTAYPCGINDGGQVLTLGHEGLGSDMRSGFCILVPTAK
ncbi:MAG TPA: hypothetical protein VG944_06900 [Fimbriimonas sp.]|nr:hypothetical protein [Fimbriimonas sp.]